MCMPIFKCMTMTKCLSQSPWHKPPFDICRHRVVMCRQAMQRFVGVLVQAMQDVVWKQQRSSARLERGLLVDLTPLPATRQHHLLQAACIRKKGRKKNSRSVLFLLRLPWFWRSSCWGECRLARDRPDSRPAASSGSDGLGPGFIPLNSSIHHGVREEEDGDLISAVIWTTRVLAAGSNMKSSCLQ